MRVLGYLVVASMALALLQAAVKFAVLIVILGAFGTFVARPRETIALVTALGVLNLVALYPLPSVAIIGAFAAAKGVSRWRARDSEGNSSSDAMRRIARQEHSRRD